MTKTEMAEAEAVLSSAVFVQPSRFHPTEKWVNGMAYFNTFFMNVLIYNVDHWLHVYGFSKQDHRKHWNIRFILGVKLNAD